MNGVEGVPSDIAFQYVTWCFRAITSLTQNKPLELDQLYALFVNLNRFTSS
jgi:hypothetical protein